MSDWNKQTTELVNTWTETQKKMWDTWLGAMETMTPGSNPKGLGAERQKIMDAWEASLSKGLAAQTEWAGLWADSLAASKSTPKPMVEWAKQLQEMMKSWSASQEQLSHVWFEMMKKMDTAEMSETWEKSGKELVRVWQDAVDKAIEAQREMSKAVTQTQKRS